jgi:putative PEP-CTERM system TPR-repeat lipoprotein
VKAEDVDSTLANAPLVEADTLMKAGKLSEAIERLERIRASKPRDLQTLNLLGVANIQAGNREAAKTIFEEAITIDPSYDIAAVNLVSIYAQLGEFARAEKLLAPVLEREPLNAQILGMSVALDVNMQKVERARQKISAAIERAPDDTELLLISARFERDTGNLETSLNSYDTLIQKPNPRAEWIREYCMAQLAAGRFGSAMNTADKLVKRPNPLAMDYLLLARAARQMRDGTKARQALARALEIAPDDPSARLENIRAMVDAREVQPARAAMVALKRLIAPHELPDVLFVDSMISVLENDPESAMKSAERAFDLQPTGNRAIDLARVYATSGEQDKAVNALQKWVLSNPRDTAAMFVLADAQDKMGHEGEAIETYENLLKLVPDEPLALNNLAWLLREKDATRALTLAAQAHRAAPDTTAIMDTYGVLLLDKGDARKSVEILRGAAEQAPHNASVAVHLALALLRSGNAEEARRTIGRYEMQEIPDALLPEYRVVLQGLDAE